MLNEDLILDHIELAKAIWMITEQTGYGTEYVYLIGGDKPNVMRILDETHDKLLAHAKKKRKKVCLQRRNFRLPFGEKGLQTSRTFKY